jgi:hypothetical protein
MDDFSRIFCERNWRGGGEGGDEEICRSQDGVKDWKMASVRAQSWGKEIKQLN